VWVRGAGWWRGMSGKSGVDVAFTDRAGSHWIRRATGELIELPQPPLNYLQPYGLHGPHDYQTPERQS